MKHMTIILLACLHLSAASSLAANPSSNPAPAPGPSSNPAPGPGPAPAPASAADGVAAAAPANPDLAAGITELVADQAVSGHPGGFALLTHGREQYVAYYNAGRQMSVAQRRLGEKTWTITKLDSFVGWDSHNYIRMAVDRDGHLHLSGNMHVDPLVYFRAEKPGDASSLRRMPGMTGLRESRATYPRFFYSPEGALVFSYRDGESGRGDTLYNIYDEKTRAWRRLLDQPLFDGRGEMSAYPIGPGLGPDGCYHLTWVWRDTMAAETNHDLGYARSRDLVHWETITGAPVRLPITISTPGVTVDPIPVKGGIINGSGHAGFDHRKNVVIAYHKFDAAGLTQLYFARFIDGQWQSTQASRWDYRWWFHGGGSIVAEIRHGAPAPLGDDLAISIKHPRLGSGLWLVEPLTLQLIRKVPSGEPPLPAHLRKPRSSFSGMEVRAAGDSSLVKTPGATYRLHWESLPNNRDQPRPKPWPEPATLRVVVLPSGAAAGPAR
jgi:hypothetical protein